MKNIFKQQFDACKRIGFRQCAHTYEEKMAILINACNTYGMNPCRDDVEVEVIKLEDKKYLEGTYLVICEAPHQNTGLEFDLHGFRTELLIRVFERFKTPYLNIIEFKQFYPKPPQWKNVNDYYNIKTWDRPMVIRPGSFPEKVVNWLKSSALKVKE